MTSEFRHGVFVSEENDGARPIAAVSTAVIGAVFTSSDADATLFPLNTPVLVNDPNLAAGKAGDQGTLARALEAIGSQTTPYTIVVRVPEGASAAETTSNIVGGSVNGKYTGLKALLTAEARLGMRPRILGVPGLDTQAVTAELAVIAQQLGAFAYANAHGCESKEEVLAYRAGFSHRELMLMWPDFLSWDTVSSSEKLIPAVAMALGLRARIDQEIGWHKTLSNVALNGVTGISKDVSFNMESAATDANYLNEKGITTLIRSDGFRFWGNRTCSDDPLFQFETDTRTAQVLKTLIAAGVKWGVDKGIHPSLATDIVEYINGRIRTLVREGKLIGGKCWVSAAANPAGQLAGGKLVIDYDYTAVPPLENLHLRQRKTDRYLADFSALLAAA